MAATEGLLAWLEAWYQSQANGEWEHAYGIRVTTLDNPGWNLRVDLAHTALEGKHLNPVRIERSETDWLSCWVKDGGFEGACGPANLEELLGEFRGFADRSD